jgi:Predicted ATPase
MDYIKIKGYKSIKDLHLELKPINVLIGANGAGKSNFISFFSFLKKAYDKLLQETVARAGGIDRYLHHGRKKTDAIESEMSFCSENNSYAFLLKTTTEGKFLVATESFGYKGKMDSYRINDDELTIKTDDAFRSKWIRTYLNGLKVYHFHEIGANSPFNSDCKIDDYFVLQNHGANLSAFLYNLQRNESVIYKRIVKVIQSVAPYFLDFDLHPNAEGSEYIRLGWRDKYSENRYGATDLSDGTIRFIALVALFLQPNPPAVIIIDEPELGLHPFAINKLSGLVQSVSERGTQVILSTQSVELVNCFTPEDIIAVDHIDGASSFNRLDSSQLSEWLSDYAVGDMWRQNLLSKGFPNK